MNESRIRELLTRTKREGFIPGAVEELGMELLSLKDMLDTEIQSLKEKKKHHRQSRQCEMTTGVPCGGCHFYSGAIASLQDLTDKLFPIRAEQAKPETETETETCVWTPRGGAWFRDCARAISMWEAVPAVCPFCGKRIEVAGKAEGDKNG